jgi:SAM-dependent methyltransferase
MSGEHTAANQEIWESRYSRGDVVNRYPYDMVVSFILRQFGKGSRADTRILDYGCGGGNHCAFLAREGFDFYGVDFSISAIRHAKSVIEAAGGLVKPNKLICTDFVHTSFPDNHFDAVIDRQSLDQNMASALPALVAEIHRVLKPGGKYLGINFSDRHPALSYGKALGNGDYAEFSRGPFKDIGTRHFFSHGELLSLFRNFTIVDLKTLSLHSLIHEGQGSEEFVLFAQKPGQG